MAITAPVSLSKIIAEFGGPGNLGAYVRGGAYVPDTPANAAIATVASGLATSQFEGASAAPAVTVTLGANYFIQSQLDSGSIGDPTAIVWFQNDGHLITQRTMPFASPAIDHDPVWGVGLVASEYEMRVINFSGDALTTSAGLNTWLNLGSTRRYDLRWTSSIDGGKQCTFDVQIRKVGTTTVLASTHIELIAARGIAM